MTIFQSHARLYKNHKKSAAKDAMEKQYNAQQCESTIQNMWLERQIYKATDFSSKPIFSIDTPPPTISGSLHIGHIFSYTQTDIIARYKRMHGFSVIYPFGFDDNGLPTERYVEKKLGIRAESLKRSEFIQLCLQETKQTEDDFQKLWQALGLSVDWDLTYSTISLSTQKISQESFIRLYHKGYVYREYEPALYCVTCKTSVAQAELDEAQQETFFYDIIFTLEDGTPVTIATTRPEFLPACVAVLYHPDDTRYNTLAGKTVTVPLFNAHVPLIAHEDVVMDKGTGLVMCCIFGDKQDIVWAKNLKFSYHEKQILGRTGHFNEKAGFLSGLTIKQARAAVIEALTNKQLIVHTKPITNTVNIHERCKKNIEYLALEQWFVKILPYKKDILQLAQDITWYPNFMKKRFIDWVENIGWNWCISRQRFFGIPFPAWYCADCGHINVPPLEALPLDPQENSYFSACGKCSSNNLVPDSDVMDTWNSSSLTPQIISSLLLPETSPFDNPEKNFIIPMSMRPQAHDIIRTWAFYTIVKSWMHYGDTVPWKNVVISGHVLSNTQEKLSKSKENSKLAPEMLLQSHSADAIRYWTASARLGHDVSFSENQLRIGAKLITKLWNAFRFIKEHFPTTNSADPIQLGIVNEWLIHEYTTMWHRYCDHLNSYEISLALQELEQFFWNIFCDNYLEIIKDSLFNPEKYDPELVEATRRTLQSVGYGLLQCFAPYLVYVTEQIFLELFAENNTTKSLHTTTFVQHSKTMPQSAAKMKIALDIITQVRRLKTEQKLSLKTPLARLYVYGLDHTLNNAKELEQTIRGVTHAESMYYQEQAEIELSHIQLNQNEWTAHVVILAT